MERERGREGRREGGGGGGRGRERERESVVNTRESVVNILKTRKKLGTGSKKKTCSRCGSLCKVGYSFKE